MDTLFWFVLGGSGYPFAIILEVLGVQMGWFLSDFEGLVASLGAFGAQFAPGPPSLFHGRPLFRDFDAEREPKASENGAKINKKTV